MRWKSFLPRATAIVLVAFIVYWPCLRGEFVWDDGNMVSENAMVKASDGLYRLWFTTEPLDYFPLTSTSFWLEWRLWGLHTAGYHVTNVLLHAAGAALIWLVLERLRAPGAWLAAMVFTVHPVNVQSVAWIAERKNTLCMVFYAASLLAFLKSLQEGRRGLYWLSVFLFLPALLSKTSVVMMPFALLGCAWWLNGKVTRRDLWRAAPFFGLSAALGVITVWFQSRHIGAGGAFAMPSALGRLATAGCAVWFYLAKAFAPVRLCTAYPGWDTIGTAGMPLWPAFLLAALFAVFWIYRDGWGRPFLFGLGYYVAMLLPVLGFVNMYVMKISLVMDHFQYPAIIGVIALVIGLAAHGMKRAGPHMERVAPAAAVALIGALGFNTWQEAGLYRSSEELWRYTLALNPNCWAAHINYGPSLLQKGKKEEALWHYLEAVRLRPDEATAHYDVGYVLLLMDKPKEAIEPLWFALKLSSRYAEAHGVLGEALRRTGQFKEAEAHFLEALRLKPDAVNTRYNWANALAEHHRMEEAAANYREVLRATPDFPEAHNNLARVLASEGRIEEAVRHYRAALELKPDSALVLDNFAWLLACSEDARYRDGAEALRLAERAFELSAKDDVKALDTLGAACAAAGRFEDAARYAEKALEAASAAGEGEKAGRIRERLELYRAGKALRAGPGIPDE